MTNLRRIRKSKKITQVELAERLLIAQSAVSEMERKGIYSIKTANKYGKALKCSTLSLIEI